MTLLQELKKPFNIVTLTLAIFSILLSLFLYLKNEKSKSVSYSIDETPSIIYDNQNSVTAIKIFEKDTIPIKNNIYLISGTIWNSGDFPVSNSDVRSPLSISLSDSNRILDSKITKQNNEKISKFIFTKDSDTNLKIDWNYFDPGFGFNFQIIYVGENSSGFELKGNILDISNFEKIEKQKETSLTTIVLGVVFGIVLLFFSVLNVYRSRKVDSDFVLVLLNLLQVLIPIGYLVYLLINYYNHSIPKI